MVIYNEPSPLWLILIEHWQAFALAAASSTDNFCVGLSIGLGGHRLSMLVLWGTSTCNALGAMLATASGSWVQDQISDNRAIPSLLAAVAFGYLGWKEYNESLSNSAAATNVSTWIDLAELALPMTLNNLAGGVAGGVVGVSKVVASLHVWIVSIIFMWLGYRVGYSATKKESDREQSSSSLTSWSVLLYGLLTLQSVVQAIWPV